MNAFDRYNQAPPESEEQWIRREEEAERFLERSTRERLVEENWVEVAEFAVPKPARMQMDLSFEEVA